MELAVLLGGICPSRRVALTPATNHRFELVRTGIQPALVVPRGLGRICQNCTKSPDLRPRAMPWIVATGGAGRSEFP